MRYAQLFVRAVHRYISGLGHPQHRLMTEFQTISQTEIVSALGNTVTRAQLLLAAFTNSVELPRDDLPWSLQVGVLPPQSPCGLLIQPCSSSWKILPVQTLRQVDPMVLLAHNC